MEGLLSYIEPHEVRVVQQMLRESIGEDIPRPFGDQIVVKLYIRPDEILTVKDKDGKEVKLYWPDLVCYRDRFHSCVALVMSIGHACENLHYRIGDFIMIPRNEGTQLNYAGVVIHIIKHDKVYEVIKEPKFFKRVYYKEV